MMKYWVRILMGVGLGLVGTLLLAWLTGGWGLAAGVGSLLACVGFLGSYFVWSADVPPSPENPAGYEQVLFDRPNSLVSLALVVAMVGAAWGAALVFGDSDGPSPAMAAFVEAARPLADQARELADRLTEDVRAAAAGEVSPEDFSTRLDGHLAILVGLKAEADALDVPAEAEPVHGSLLDAVQYLTMTARDNKQCMEGDTVACQVAQGNLDQSWTALDALAGALGSP